MTSSQKWVGVDLQWQTRIEQCQQEYKWTKKIVSKSPSQKQTWKIMSTEILKIGSMIHVLNWWFPFADIQTIVSPFFLYSHILKFKLNLAGKLHTSYFRDWSRPTTIKDSAAKVKDKTLVSQAAEWWDEFPQQVTHFWIKIKFETHIAKV